MNGITSMTMNGPEICHSALAEACEKELVARIMRGDAKEWREFYDGADAWEIASCIPAALKEQSDADVAMGALTLSLEKLAKEYAVGYIAHAADKGSLEDLGRELGLIEESGE